MSRAARASGERSLRALLLSVLLAALGYLAFSLWVGWAEVLAALGRIGWFGTALALALSLVNYGLRFFRWQLYLHRLAYPIPWRPSGQIYLSGFALTTTPGKAGEAFRGVLLKAWGVPFPVTLAAFLSERLSDLVAIILLALLGLLPHPEFRPLVAIGALAVLGVYLLLSSKASLLALKAWAGRGPSALRRVMGQGLQLALEARACHAPKLLLGATLLSVFAWAAEGLAFYLTLGWLEADVALTAALFIYAIAMLAGALSFLPGGLGSAEAVMVSLLVLEGLSPGVAAAATVFIRLTTLWFAVGLGSLALLLHAPPAGRLEQAA